MDGQPWVREPDANPNSFGRTHLNNDDQDSHNLSLKRVFLIQPDACVGNILVGVGGGI